MIQKRKTTMAEAMRRCTIEPKSRWAIEQVREEMLKEGATEAEVREMVESTPVLPEEADF